MASLRFAYQFENSWCVETHPTKRRRGLAIGCVLLLALSLSLDQLASAQSPTAPRSPMFPGAPLFNEQPPFLAGVSVDHADATYRDGDKLRVQFVSEIEAHLYLFYHQADGTSLLLFPNSAHRESKVVGRAPVVIPPAGEEFRFRIRPPFGKEVLQVLAAKTPVDELEALAGQGAKAARVDATMFRTLAERLGRDTSGWTEHRVPITTLGADERPSNPKPGRVGLFIGIGKYLRPEIAATHEELRHSAEVMHEWMLKHGGLDPQRTLLVRDSEATKANLQSLIADKLPSVTQPGDTVFIYFSGHAGQVDTNDPSESDGKDETIGPYDLEGGRPGESRQQAEARFRATNITDDTLAAWISRLQGRQVVLILDTCHSGGVIAGKNLSKSLSLVETARLKDIAQTNTLVLASCAADEQSLFEGTPNKTMWFTYCLTEAIEKSAGKRALTVQEAFEYSRVRMRALLHVANAPREQEPVMADRILLPIELIPKP